MAIRNVAAACIGALLSVPALTGMARAQDFRQRLGATRAAIEGDRVRARLLRLAGLRFAGLKWAG